MRSLQNLNYSDFPERCMPSSFLQSLQKIDLRPYDWSQGLPIGLQNLCNLEKLCFDSRCKDWQITRSLADFLPVHSLEQLELG